MLPRSEDDDEIHNALVTEPRDLRGIKCEGFHADTLVMARMVNNGTAGPWKLGHC